MSYIVNRTDFMFKEVRSPVFFTAYATGSVMGNRSAPHQIGTGSVVFRVFHDGGCLFDDGKQGTFAQAVAYFYFFGIGEIAFHDVRHHIGNAASGLKRRKCVGQFRVHHGENGTQYRGSTET